MHRASSSSPTLFGMTSSLPCSTSCAAFGLAGIGLTSLGTRAASQAIPPLRKAPQRMESIPIHGAMRLWAAWQMPWREKLSCRVSCDLASHDSERNVYYIRYTPWCSHWWHIKSRDCLVSTCCFLLGPRGPSKTFFRSAILIALFERFRRTQDDSLASGASLLASSVKLGYLREPRAPIKAPTFLPPDQFY